MAANFTLVSAAGLPVWRSSSVRTCHPGGIAPPPATTRSGSPWADSRSVGLITRKATAAGTRTGNEVRIAHMPPTLGIYVNQPKRLPRPAPLRQLVHRLQLHDLQLALPHRQHDVHLLLDLLPEQRLAEG